MKFSHRVLLIISGLLWFGMGAYLLTLGLNLIVSSSNSPFQDAYTPLLNALSSLVKGKENGSVLLITLGLFIGYAKGKYVLSKSAKRILNRLKTLPNPTSLGKLYTPAFYILIGCMMLLGMSMRWFSVPFDIRGLIDVAVGSALVNGAMVYFRNAQTQCVTCDKVNQKE